MRDTNRREVSERLIERAIALFLAGGVEGVTIDELAARAEIAKGSFYRYAKDKADLVSKIMAPVGEEVVAALARCEAALASAQRDTLAATYLRLAAELSVVVTKFSSRVRLYLQEVRAPASPSRRAIHAIAEDIAVRGVTLTRIARDHALIRDVDPRVSALAVLGAVEALLFEQLRARGGDIGKEISELVGIVLGGIRRA